MKKILLISSGYGSGHRSAGKAIETGIKNWTKNCEVKHIDFGEIVGNLTDKIFRKSYFTSIKYMPAIHRLMAASSDSDLILELASKFYAPIASRKLEKIIKQFGPDVVVTTFPAANRLIDTLKTKHNFKLLTVVTDLLSIHKYWVSHDTDYYLVALDEMIPIMEVLGIPKEKIIVTGFAIRPNFLEKNNKKELRKKYKLDPEKFTALYLLGSTPDNFTPLLAQKMDQAEDFQSVIVCGNNKSSYKKFSKKLKNTHLVGFTDKFHEYLEMCDIVIGKAGACFVMEAATMGKPTIITNYIAPQEQGNVELIISRKWGWFAPGADLVMEKIHATKNLSPEKYSQMEKNARETSRPDCTQNIVKFIASC